MSNSNFSFETSIKILVICIFSCGLIANILYYYALDLDGIITSIFSLEEEKAFFDKERIVVTTIGAIFGTLIAGDMLVRYW